MNREKQLAKVQERKDTRVKPRLPHYGKGAPFIEDIRGCARSGGFGEFAPEDFIGPEAMKCLKRMQ